MKRHPLVARSEWRKRCEADGLVWTPYWNEGAYYSLTPSEVTAFQVATETLYKMLLDAGNYVITRRLFAQFEIPEYIVPTLIRAWHEEPPALNYGRFDLGYADGQIKLFEFNCDTPTSLIEASIAQWRWKEDQFPSAAQANDIHEHLLARWKDIAGYLPGPDIHVMAVRDTLQEDMMTATYMAELAREAGLKPIFITPAEVGWDARRRQFVDLANQRIATLYKLYPWEWLLSEDFGRNIPAADTIWIEPVWKALWSNKAILPILWKLFPDHPLLLEAAFEPLTAEHVIKPILGREGRGIRLSSDPERAVTDGLLGKTVYQKKFELVPTEGNYPVVGSWIVDGRFAGLGVREGGLITGNTSSFVPHIVTQSDDVS
jgi:glutathionylspermidine synthase